MKKSKCEVCGCEFDYEPQQWMGKEVSAPRVCQPCADAEEKQREAEEKRRGAEKRFLEVCPPLYRQTDTKRLPRAFLQAIEEWKFGPTGIGFIGKPGIGKTRAAFLLIRRVLEEGRSVAAVGSTGFNDLCVRQFSGNDDERSSACDEISEIRWSEVTLIDDVGKGKMTERAEMELYALLEHRTSYELPTIWTANSGVDFLTSVMSKDRGPAIVRRLVEFSRVIQ
jgi:DNA replication protein DnaC